jgi:hypothetical protein
MKGTAVSVLNLKKQSFAIALRVILYRDSFQHRLGKSSCVEQCRSDYYEIEDC